MGRASLSSGVHVSVVQHSVVDNTKAPLPPVYKRKVSVVAASMVHLPRMPAKCQGHAAPLRDTHMRAT